MDAVTLAAANAAAKKQMREIEMYCDFTAMPNGVPTKATSGHALTIWNNGNNASGMTVTGGQLVHGAPTAANGASYMEAVLARPWVRMGARCTFSGTGQVALIPWADPGVVAALSATPQQAIPNSPTHAVFRSSDFHISKWVSGGGGESAYLIADAYPYGMPASPDGTWTWELYREGSTVWVKRPDGSFTRQITDPQIASQIGNRVCVELYESASGATPATVLEWWAQS